MSLLRIVVSSLPEISSSLVVPPPPPPPYEDLTTYTEVDPDGKLVISPDTRVTYTQINAVNMDWLYKTRSFPGDYSIDFEVCCTGHRGNISYNGDFYCLAVMDTSSPFSSDHYLGGAILCEELGVGPKLGVYQGDGWVGQFPQVVQSVNQGQVYYCTLERSAGTLRLYIYTDSARTSLLATLTSPTTDTRAGSYIYACAGGAGEENGWVTGYTQNILIS